MGQALWRVSTPEGVRIARGLLTEGPTELLPVRSIDELLSTDGPSLVDALHMDSSGPVPDTAGLLAPVDNQEIWASGVTFERSRAARNEETTTADVYDRVYDADRPELFFKSPGWRVCGEGASIGIRTDSGWDVPEPELGMVVDARGTLVAYTVGNDVTSRRIEADNPLYLPQAKIFHGACAVGPALVPVECAPPFQELAIHMTITRAGESVFEDRVGLSSMKRKPEELIHWVFQALDFPVGFVLLSGTAIVPPAEFTLMDGDVVVISIPGVGVLTNRVAHSGKATPDERREKVLEGAAADSREQL